ncbi:MAG: hypothetical protein WC150_09930 [Bacteroidia bacterium]
MKDKIWYEFLHTKHGDDYLVLYLGRLKRTRKIINILTIVFSTTGIFSWKIWLYLPSVTSGVIALIQIFKLLENQFVVTDKDIEQVSILRNMYFEHWNNVEKLWIEYQSKEITEKQATARFFALRKFAKSIEALDTKLSIQTISTLQDKADMRTNDYIKQYHS